MTPEAIVKQAPAWLRDLEKLAKKAPKASRAQIDEKLNLLRFVAAGKMSPEYEARDKAAVEAKKAEESEALAAEVRRCAIKSLKPALDTLAQATDVARAAEDGNVPYLEADTLARCARLLIEEAGEELEQALCDLGLIQEDSYSFFSGDLKSHMPKSARAAEVDHA